MMLEGVVTNIVAFGAFVDIGVHQDGLVHVSQVAEKFVRDPAEVVRVGDRVAVRVMSVDLERGRIALSMRADAGTPRAPKPERGATPDEARSGGGSGAPAGKGRPAAPAPFTPKPGSVAPNGIRFK